MDRTGGRVGRVLVVDDNPMNLMILEEILEEFELETSTDGRDALQKVKSFRPDVVVLDVMMPGMDGYEVCRRIRSDETLRPARVLFVSAKAMTGEIERGYEVGGDGYISKPFDHDVLLHRVRELVDARLDA